MPESTTTNPEQEHQADADADAPAKPPATLEEQVQALLDRMDRVAEETAREHNVTVNGEPLGVDGADAAKAAVPQGVVTDSGVKAAPVRKAGDAPPEDEAEVEEPTTEAATDEFDEAEPPEGDFEDPSTFDDAVDELVEQAQAGDPALEASVAELVEAAQPSESSEEDGQAEGFEAPEAMIQPADEPAEIDPAESSDEARGAAPVSAEDSVQAIDEALAAEADETSWDPDGSEDTPTGTAAAEPPAVDTHTTDAVEETEDEEGLVDLPSMQIAVGDDSSWKSKQKAAEAGEDAPDDEPPADEIEADFEAVDDLEHEPAEGDFEPPPGGAPDEELDAIVEHGPRGQQASGEGAPPRTDTPVPEGETLPDPAVEAEPVAPPDVGTPSQHDETPAEAAPDAESDAATPHADPVAAPAEEPIEAAQATRAPDSLVAKIKLYADRCARMVVPAVRQARQHAPTVWARVRPAVHTALYWLNWPYRQIPAEYRDTVGWLAAVTGFMAIVVWFIALR
jgi:hypothetical protein